MNRIIITTLALCGGAAANASDMDTFDMVSQEVQIAAATHASFNDNFLTTNIGGFLQTGWSYNDAGGNDAEYGFGVDRARLILSGDMGDETMSYLVSGQWSDSTNAFDLLDARVDLKMFDFGNIRVGQFVPGFYSGYVTDPRDLTTLNYSVSALTFGQGRGQGVEFSRTCADVFHISAFYNNGFNDTVGVGGDNNYAVGGRIEYDGLSDFVFGGGFGYNDNTVDLMTYTVDVTYVGEGWHANAAWIANDGNDTWDNYSLVGTVGYDLTKNFELFGQYEYGILSGANSDLNLCTVGGNYHFNDYIVWTNSVGYAFNAIDASFNTENTGWKTSSEDGQFVIRSGVTVSF